MSTKFMSWIRFMIKNKYKIIILIYLLLFSRLFKLCYEIHNFNYIIIIFIYFLVLFFHWFYEKIFNKFILKIFFIITFLSVFLILILTLYHVIYPYAIVYNFFVNNFINNFIYINNAYLNSEPINFNMLIPFLLIIIPAIISVVVYFKNKIPVITIMITLPLMYLFWYNNVSTKFYTNIYIILSSFELGLNIHQSSLRKARNKNYKVLVPINNNMIYIIIMVALTAVFTGFAGENFGVKSIEQYNKDKMVTVINEVNSVKNKYELSYSGYGSNSFKLGGPIKINYNLALKVKSIKPMYLRGNVLEYYNGFGWTGDSDGYYIFNSKPINKVIESEIIEIIPQTLLSSTFFTPLNTFNVVSKNSNIMRNGPNIFIVGNKTNVTLPYTIEYNLTEVEKLTEDASYEKEVQEKYSRYLQLPDNITPETYNLVKELIKTCKNNEEKIDKIRKYLKENYKYSLEVSSVPENQEFLDYFLFKEKKGYCTYFATAATIFARIAGIPARYVEGFSMDNTRDSNGVYSVGNNRAHAWAEILISPSKNSWKIFECTPSYSEIAQQNKDNSSKINLRDVRIIDSKTKPAKNISLKSMPKIKGSYLFIIFFIGLLVFLLAMVFIRIRRLVKNKNKILGAEGIIPLYYYGKKRLSTIGIKWSDSFSDEEGALDLKDEILREHFINIVKVFYEEYYGGIIDKSFNKIEFYKYLEGYIKKNSNFFKYYYRK